MNKAAELAKNMSAENAWTDFVLDDVLVRRFGEIGILTGRLTLKGGGGASNLAPDVSPTSSSSEKVGGSSSTVRPRWSRADRLRHVSQQPKRHPMRVGLR